jgi:hypothetical protein
MTYGPGGGTTRAGGVGFGITGGRESATGLPSQYGGFSYGKPAGWSDEDYAQAVATVAAEVSRKGNVLDMARIADVIANRESLGKYGKTVTDIIQAKNQFSAATSLSPKNKPAHDIYNAVYDAVKTGNMRAAERLGVADRVTAAKAAIDGVKVTGDLRGSAKGATAYDNKRETGRLGTGAYHRGLEAAFGSFTVGEHTFTGSRKDGFNPSLPDINPNAYATSYSDLRDWQGPETALAAGRAAAAAPDYDQPNWSLADLAPDVTQPPAPDWGRDMTDRTQRGPVTDPYGFSTLDIGMPSAQISGLPGTNQAAAQGGLMSAQAAPVGGGYGIGAFGPNAFGAMDAYTAPPDWGMEQGAFGDRGVTGYDFGNQSARNGIGLGVTGYDPGALGTAAMPDIGPYDPLGAAREAFPDRSVATDMSLAGLSPVGQGVVGTGYNPAVVAAAEPIGAPSMRGMSFDQMTRGIVGYEDKPVTTTTQVPNPAYSAWEEAYNNPKATTQQMYADDLADKLGQPTAFQGSVMNQAPQARGPAPSKTIGHTTTTTTRSPVYGDVPVGQPIGANLSQAGAGSWTSGLTNQANAINANIMDMGNWGLQGMQGTFNTGLSPVGYGGGIGSLGSLGGGAPNVGSGWGLGGEAGGVGGSYGGGGFAGGDAGYGSDARSGREGADQGNL